MRRPPARSHPAVSEPIPNRVTIVLPPSAANSALARWLRRLLPTAVLLFAPARNLPRKALELDIAEDDIADDASPLAVAREIAERLKAGLD